MAHVPGVFVSSTCYDLNQIRRDLETFIAQLGYRPVMSDLPSFYVDTDLSTADNCRENVRHNADIFVLIVGHRYGSIESGKQKSITNSEYDEAKLKGIPIFAFVESGIIATLPVWRENPKMKFKSVADTPKLFEFVDQLRSEVGKWTFPFDTAQDIQNTLIHQFAYLMQTGLDLRLKFRDAPDRSILATLDGRAARIILEHENYWASRAFVQILWDEVCKYDDLLHEYSAGVTIRSGDYVQVEELAHWMQHRAKEAIPWMLSLNKILIEVFPYTMANVRKPDGVANLIRSARLVAKVYGNWLEAALKIRNTIVPEEAETLREMMALLSDSNIRRFKPFVRDFLDMTEAAAFQPVGACKPEVNVAFEIETPDLDQLMAEIDRVIRYYGLDTDQGS